MKPYSPIPLLPMVLFLCCLANLLQAQQWDLTSKLNPENRHAHSGFGKSVAIFNNYAVVGAPDHHFNSTHEDSLFQAGAAFVYKKDEQGKWFCLQMLLPGDRDAEDKFGSAVAISENYILVSSPLEDEPVNSTDTLEGAGAVYVFALDTNGLYNESQKLVAPKRARNANFGTSISLTSEWLVIGSQWDKVDVNNQNEKIGAGAVYFYSWHEESNIWNFSQKAVAPDRSVNDHFGWDVDITDGQAIVSAKWEEEDTANLNPLLRAGSAYIFETNAEGHWNYSCKLVARDREELDYFAYSVSITQNMVAVGAPREEEDADTLNAYYRAGSVYIFARDTLSGTWEQTQKLVPNDREPESYFGYSIDLGDEYLLIGSSTYNYPDTEDGYYDSIYSDAGVAYIYRQDEGDRWVQHQRIADTGAYHNDQFGYSVGLWENELIVGSPFDDEKDTSDNTLVNAGSSFIFSTCIDYSRTDHISLCPGDSIYLEDEWQVADGIFMDYYTSLKGCDSIITTHLTFVSYLQPQEITLCQGDSILLAGNWQYTSGIYIDSLISITGCDSLVETTVISEELDVSISTDIYGYAANSQTGRYQWMDCSTGSIVSDERNFMPGSDGSFALIISGDHCSDTSACFNHEQTGLAPISSYLLNIYPVPAQEQLNIELVEPAEEITIRVLDLRGQVMLIRNYSLLQKITLATEGLLPGTYLLQVSTKMTCEWQRFVKD